MLVFVSVCKLNNNLLNNCKSNVTIIALYHSGLKKASILKKMEELSIKRQKITIKGLFSLYTIKRLYDRIKIENCNEMKVSI